MSGLQLIVALGWVALLAVVALYVALYVADQTTRCGLAIAWMVASTDAASWYAGLSPCPDCWPDGYRADARGDGQNAR